jgi:hypothetical protein
LHFGHQGDIINITTTKKAGPHGPNSKRNNRFS